MTTEILRPELEPLPDRMKALRVHRGYPVPWFVATINGEPEFRIMDTPKWPRAIKERLCWVCGTKLDRQFVVFVAGPMCGINRTSSEPPCHLICAQWSARNCPFLSKPQMVRRENAMPEKIQEMPGIGLLRNPGVTLLWITKGFELFDAGPGKQLIRMGEPERVEWWALGKPATREQVEESVAGGLPALQEVARLQPGGWMDLQRRRIEFEALYPPALSEAAS